MLESTRRASERPPRPPAWHQRQYLAIVLVLLGVALYFNYGEHLPVPGAFGDVGKLSGQSVFNEWVWTAAIVTSFYFVFGIAGRFAFSTAAFVGLGAYVSHAVTRESDLTWAVGFVVAVAVASVLAFAFAMLLRNAQHFYFAVATLGLSEILVIVFRQWTPLTGRSSGEIVSATRMSIFGWNVLARDRQFWVLLALLAVVLFLGALIARSPLVRNAIAARDNPRVVDTLGTDSRWPGVVMFTLGSALAAAAGSIFVHTRGIGTPETFGIELGIGVFVALIIGGLHSLWGGLIGSWFYIYIPLYLRRWESWTQVIWGVTLVFVMIVFPDGLVGLFTRLRNLMTGRHGPGRPPPWEPVLRLFGREPDGSAEPPAPTSQTRLDEGQPT